MITIKSHGFKFSRPEANFVFDVSYLKNPWRDARVISGEITPEKSMFEQKEFSDIVTSIATVVETYYKFFPDENIVVAICCSAGEYRSPCTANAVGRILREKNIPHVLKIDGLRIM